MTPVKKRLLKAKFALTETVEKILAINQKRKRLRLLEDGEAKKRKLEMELEMLNDLAEQQAHILRKYETMIQRKKEAS